MSRKKIIDKLDNVEREVREIKEYLSQSELETVTSRDFPLAIKPDFSAELSKFLRRTFQTSLQNFPNFSAEIFGDCYGVVFQIHVYAIK